MMRRWGIGAVLLAALSLIGCSGQGKTNANAPQNGNEEAKAQTKQDGGIDVDLTKMSSTMVYSEVYSMLDSPEDYVGKTVKMNGSFAIYQDTDEDGNVLQNYFACIIADATACCSQGIEFQWQGDHSYPEDYPELGDQIVVEGVFDTYMDDGYQYCQLVDASMQAR